MQIHDFSIIRIRLFIVNGVYSLTRTNTCVNIQPKQKQSEKPDRSSEGNRSTLERTTNVSHTRLISTPSLDG